MGNVRYGIREPNRNFETTGLHEAIISEEFYNEAQILMEKNSRISPTKQPKEQNYFTGFVYCDKCGGRLLSHNSITKNKNGTVCKVYSFYCRRRIMNVCDSKGVTAKKIECALLEYFSRVDDFSVLDAVELAETHRQARQDTEAQINTLNEKIKKLDGKEREVMSLYIDGDIEFKNYREMKKQLDGDRDFIRAEIVKLKITLDEKEEPSISKADIITNFRENWENLTDLEKRQFLTKFIKKIVLVNEPIEGTKQGHTVITSVQFCGE